MQSVSIQDAYPANNRAQKSPSQVKLLKPSPTVFNKYKLFNRVIKPDELAEILKNATVYNYQSNDTTKTNAKIIDLTKTNAKTTDPSETVSSFKNTNKSSNVADKSNNTGDNEMMKIKNDNGFAYKNKTSKSHLKESNKPVLGGQTSTFKNDKVAINLNLSQNRLDYLKNVNNNTQDNESRNNGITNSRNVEKNNQTKFSNKELRSKLTYIGTDSLKTDKVRYFTESEKSDIKRQMLAMTKVKKAVNVKMSTHKVVELDKSVKRSPKKHYISADDNKKTLAKKGESLAGNDENLDQKVSKSAVEHKSPHEVPKLLDTITPATLSEKLAALEDLRFSPTKLNHDFLKYDKPHFGGTIIAQKNNETALNHKVSTQKDVNLDGNFKMSTQNDVNSDENLKVSTQNNVNSDDNL